MAQIDSRYADYAAYIALIYRHGLLHQHNPKQFRYRNIKIDWCFSIGSQNLPIDIRRKQHLTFLQNCLTIDMTIFYQDTLNSVDLALKEILNKYKESFQKSYKEQHKHLTKISLMRKYKGKKILNGKDFSFLNNLNI